MSASVTPLDKWIVVVFGWCSPHHWSAWVCVKVAV